MFILKKQHLHFHDRSADFFSADNLHDRIINRALGLLVGLVHIYEAALHAVNAELHLPRASPAQHGLFCVLT